MCDVLVRVDVFEALVSLQAKELAKLIQRRATPATGLIDTLDFNNLESLWDHLTSKGSCWVIHGFLQDTNEVFIFELAVLLSFEIVKSALAWIFRQFLIEFQQGLAELGHADVLQVICVAVREKLQKEVVDPALVLARDAAVEAIKQVELDANLISDA